MGFNLQDYLRNGINNLVKDIAKASLHNPKASLFMAQFALANKISTEKRKDSEEKGEHIPPFLIANITTKCNLHCAGCYARANNGCIDGCSTEKLLSTDDWRRIFHEAEDLGISFILLVGGEPFMRPNVLKIAGSHKKILFPIFTNGTLLNESGMKIIEQYQNLFPILSIEGNEITTDTRRGSGTYTKLSDSMIKLKKKSKVYGASITVQKNNLKEVMSDEFVSSLIDKGCKAVIYVEYVPVDKKTESNAPGDKERIYIKERLEELRIKFKEMIFIAFPGDEEAIGGCLAAGRGFFHINAYGGAEPCPFSAYSDSSLKEMSLKEALHSPLFIKLQEKGLLQEPHVGGCTLFQKEDTVKTLI